VFADGRCWYLSHDTPFDDLAKFFTLAGSRKYDRREVLGKYLIRESSVAESLVPKSLTPQLLLDHAPPVLIGRQTRDEGLNRRPVFLDDLRPPGLW
jgi:hypothetical protein